MGRVKKGWYQRLEVNRITNDWIKMNCKNITRREKKLLNIVHERKLVRRDHLEVIHDGYRNLKKRTSVLNRSITKLFRKMCLDKAHEEQGFMEGNKPAVVALDRAGCMLLNVPYKQRIKQTKRMIGNKKYVFRKLPANYYHIHGVNQLEVETIELSLKHGFEIIRWDLEEENLKKVKFKEEFTLKPDVFVVLNVGGKPFSAFIEYDTGSENNRYKDKFPTIRDKLEKYQMYKRSESWMREWWYGKIRTNFPPLLFITEDEKRIDYINRKKKSLGLNVVGILAKDYKKNMENMLTKSTP